MIGRWMLYRVCNFIKANESVLDGRYVSVNLSAKEFGGEGLVEYMKAVIASVGISPSFLKLEITETESMINIEDAIRKIDDLKSIGVDVYVDDFGSGYSSLAYLKRLPAAVVKLDRVFVDHLAASEEERAFMGGMIRMIAGKRRKVLVEGVCSAAQRDSLKALGADYLQGFFFSKAVPESDFLRLLCDGRPLPL